MTQNPVREYQDPNLEMRVPGGGQESKANTKRHSSLKFPKFDENRNL